MTRRRWRSVAAAGGLALIVAACTPAPTTVLTSLRESDCTLPAPDVQEQFASSELGVQQCGEVQGWQVLLVSSDTNSWIELRSPDGKWSSENVVVYEQPIGLFPGVATAQPLEWRVDPDRGPTALLFTVNAQDSRDGETRISRVFVARFEGDRVCLIGREGTIDLARTLAAGPTACPAS